MPVAPSMRRWARLAAVGLLAVFPAPEGELAATGSGLSAPAIFGTGCFVALAGLIASQVAARRRRKFVA